MRFLPPAVALLGAALLGAAAAPAQEAEDPLVLRVNPFRRGLEGWQRTGSDKAFTWTAEETSLAMKGQSGREPPRLIWGRGPWDRFEIRMQVKRGARKLRLVLPPEPAGEPVVVEVPRDAVRSGNWGDVLLRVEPGKAVVVVPDGEGEKEVAAAELPAGARFRFGFEAPSGTDAVVSNVRLVRTYRDGPQVCEEGFESTFPGTDLGSWRPARPESAPLFRAEKGLLIGEVRTEESGWLALAGRTYKAYELRMRALWGTDSLEIRALEVAGSGGQVNRFDTVQVNIADSLAEDNVSDIVVRLAGGTCVIEVNGKRIMDSKVNPDAGPTVISLFVHRGKRAFLRDIRIRDLAPGEGGTFGRSREEEAPPPPPKAPEAAAVAWTASGGFAESGGAHEVAAAGEGGAGLLCRASPASYVLRFQVGKGAEGLSVVPRANRGVDRGSGIRLAEAWFEKEEWVEVVLEVRLLTARVRIGSEEVGKLELDNAVGPPGLRVAPGGRARVKGLDLQATK